MSLVSLRSDTDVPERRRRADIGVERELEVSAQSLLVLLPFPSSDALGDLKGALTELERPPGIKSGAKQLLWQKVQSIGQE